MFKIKLTEKQIENFAEKIFNEIHPDYEFGDFKDLSEYVRSMWYDEAVDAIDGYNCVAENIDFPDISIMKNCCLICESLYCKIDDRDPTDMCCDEFKLNRIFNKIS